MPVSRVRVVGMAGGAALLLCVTGVLAIYAAREGHADLPPFTVAAVDRGEIRKSVATTGKLAPLVSVEVSSQISGLVVAVEADFNQTVKAGQVLTRLDPATYEEGLRRAEADMESARAVNALYEMNMRRLQRLLSEELISQQDFDEAAALWRQSKAALLTREAEVRNARVNLNRCVITSPIDGIVIFKQVEAGKTIAASFSAPILFAIAPDLSRMRIIAPINEADIGSVRVGQAVTFTVDALSGQEFRGRLAQIRNPYTPTDKPQSQEASQGGITSFDAVIEVDNEELLLRPALTANVSILIDRRVGVLRIPSGALRVQIPAGVSILPDEEGQSGGSIVYRLEETGGSAGVTRIAVKSGITDGIATEILSGLKEGDEIVTGLRAEWEVPKTHLFQ